MRPFDFYEETDFNEIMKFLDMKSATICVINDYFTKKFLLFLKQYKASLKEDKLDECKEIRETNETKNITLALNFQNLKMIDNILYQLAVRFVRKKDMSYLKEINSFLKLLTSMDTLKTSKHESISSFFFKNIAPVTLTKIKDSKLPFLFGKNKPYCLTYTVSLLLPEDLNMFSLCEIFLINTTDTQKVTKILIKIIGDTSIGFSLVVTEESNQSVSKARLPLTLKLNSWMKFSVELNENLNIKVISLFENGKPYIQSISTVLSSLSRSNNRFSQMSFLQGFKGYFQVISLQNKRLTVEDLLNTDYMKKYFVKEDGKCIFSLFSDIVLKSESRYEVTLPSQLYVTKLHKARDLFSKSDISQYILFLISCFFSQLFERGTEQFEDSLELLENMFTSCSYIALIIIHIDKPEHNLIYCYVKLLRKLISRLFKANYQIFKPIALNLRSILDQNTEHLELLKISFHLNYLLVCKDIVRSSKNLLYSAFSACLRRHAWGGNDSTKLQRIKNLISELAKHITDGCVSVDEAENGLGGFIKENDTVFKPRIKDLFHLILDYEGGRSKVYYVKQWLVLYVIVRSRRTKDIRVFQEKSVNLQEMLFCDTKTALNCDESQFRKASIVLKVNLLHMMQKNYLCFSNNLATVAITENNWFLSKFLRRSNEVILHKYYYQRIQTFFIFKSYISCLNQTSIPAQAYFSILSLVLEKDMSLKTKSLLLIDESDTIMNINALEIYLSLFLFNHQSNFYSCLNDLLILTKNTLNCELILSSRGWHNTFAKALLKIYQQENKEFQTAKEELSKVISKLLLYCLSVDMYYSHIFLFLYLLKYQSNKLFKDSELFIQISNDLVKILINYKINKLKLKDILQAVYILKNEDIKKDNEEKQKEEGLRERKEAENLNNSDEDILLIRNYEGRKYLLNEYFRIEVDYDESISLCAESLSKSCTSVLAELQAVDTRPLISKPISGFLHIKHKLFKEYDRSLIKVIAQNIEFDKANVALSSLQDELSCRHLLLPKYEKTDIYVYLKKVGERIFDRNNNRAINDDANSTKTDLMNISSNEIGEIKCLFDFVTLKKFNETSIGCLRLSENYLYFQSSSVSCSFSLSDLHEIIGFKNNLQPTTIELYFLGNKPAQLIVIFHSSKDRLSFLKYLALTEVFKKKSQFKTEKIASTIQDIQQKWLDRKISNFEYLLQLNKLSGRSFNCLSQYPIFPWLSLSFDEEVNISDLRNLSLPVGALNEERFNEFNNRSIENEDIDFLYATFYSNEAIVLYYLRSLPPFTQLHIEMQSGIEEDGRNDRQFTSVQKALDSSLKSTGDVKELIPEFYYLLPMFNKVELPVWTQSSANSRWSFSSSPELNFVVKMRELLESDYVSRQLGNWIDLIFGYAQSGDESKRRWNIFHPNTREITQNKEYLSIEHLKHFGQVPDKLFAAKHPNRKPFVPDVSKGKKTMSQILLGLDRAQSVKSANQVEKDDTTLVAVFIKAKQRLDLIDSIETFPSNRNFVTRWLFANKEYEDKESETEEKTKSVINITEFDYKNDALIVYDDLSVDKLHYSTSSKKYKYEKTFYQTKFSSGLTFSAKLIQSCSRKKQGREFEQDVFLLSHYSLSAIYVLELARNTDNEEELKISKVMSFLDNERITDFNVNAKLSSVFILTSFNRVLKLNMINGTTRNKPTEEKLSFALDKSFAFVSSCSLLSTSCSKLLNNRIVRSSRKYGLVVIGSELGELEISDLDGNLITFLKLETKEQVKDMFFCNSCQAIVVVQQTVISLVVLNYWKVAHEVKNIVDRVVVGLVQSTWREYLLIKESTGDQLLMSVPRLALRSRLVTSLEKEDNSSEKLFIMRDKSSFIRYQTKKKQRRIECYR